MHPSMIFEGILFHLEQARAQQYTTPSVGTTGVLAAERRNSHSPEFWGMGRRGGHVMSVCCEELDSQLWDWSQHASC